MPQQVSDLILSPARVFYAPVGEAIPNKDTVAAGAAWGGNWLELGFTNEPLTFAYEFDEAEADIQQSLTAPKRVKSAENLTLETVLGEFYLDALAVTIGGELTSAAPGVGTVGFQELDMGGKNVLPERQWGFEGTYIDEDGNELAIRCFVWKATGVLNGELEFGKEEFVGVPLQIKALADMGKAKGQRLYKLQKVTEAALP